MNDNATSSTLDRADDRNERNVSSNSIENSDHSTNVSQSPHMSARVGLTDSGTKRKIKVSYGVRPATDTARTKSETMNDENFVNANNQEYRIVNGLKLPPKRVVKLPPKKETMQTERGDEPKEWFYQDSKTGEEIGPLSQSQVRSLIANKVNRDTLMWKAGMEAWRTASEIELFREAFSSDRPLLPASAISDKWALCLAIIPVLVYGFLDMIGLDSIAWLPCIVLNSIYSWKDEKLLEKCRRDMGGSGCLFILGSILVPLYLLIRAVKLGGGKKWLPLVIWLFLAIFMPLLLS